MSTKERISRLDPRKPIELREIAVLAARMLMHMTGERCIAIEYGKRDYRIQRYSGDKIDRG